jgi:hypothetical protein
VKAPQVHAARELRLDGFAQGARRVAAGCIEVHVGVPAFDEGRIQGFHAQNDSVAVADQNPIDTPTMPSACVSVVPRIETTQPPEQKNWPLELIRLR